MCVVFIVDDIAVIELRVDHFSVDVSGDSGVLDVERRRTGKDSDLDGVRRKAGRERFCDARQEDGRQLGVGQASALKQAGEVGTSERKNRINFDYIIYNLKGSSNICGKV